MEQVIGLRVIRGPDWTWDDQDGGEGHVGTVVECFESNDSHVINEVFVQWDSGYRGKYRIGYDERYDLRIFSNSVVGAKHPLIKCTCTQNESFIAGMRWKCQACQSVNLCTQCYMKDSHDKNHGFLLFENATSLGVKVPARQVAEKLEIKGIFHTAKVVRGSDCEDSAQDSEDLDEEQGVVQVICDWRDMNLKDAAIVKWPSNECKLYRLGYCGKVDVTCIEAAVYMPYYVHHLPLLKEIQVQQKSDHPMTIYVDPGRNETNIEQKIKGVSHIIQNIEKFYNTGQFWDFTIKVKHRKFKIHKVILAAQSSVFATMLQNETKDKETDLVNISDCNSNIFEISDWDPSVFEDFLFYLYSRNTEKITNDNVTCLYELADKYDVSGLKEECIRFMKENISCNTFCDVMSLAVDYEDRQLIDCGTEYFVANAKAILQTSHWQTFMEKNAIPANELYIKAFKNLK